MTRNEILAHNAGVLSVLSLALQSANALDPKLVEKPTRYNFAIGALTAIAEHGQSLLMDVPSGPDVTIPASAMSA